MLEEKIQFLQQVPMFIALTNDELLDLASICRVYNFAKGAVIAYQGDVSDRMFMVSSGQVGAYKVDGTGIVQDTIRYPEKAVFKDIWLFTESTHEYTIRALSDGQLYTLAEDEFAIWLEKNPSAILDMSEEAWRELDASGVSEHIEVSYRGLSLVPGELVEFEAKRTGLILFAELSPIIGGFLLLGGLLTALFYFIGYLFSLPYLILMGLVTVVLGVWGLYRFLDWRNDYIVVTNRHLFHYDFDLRTFSGRVQQISLDMVQSIAISQDFWDKIFKMGTITINTASQTEGIIFKHLQNPAGVEETINTVRHRAGQLEQSREKEDLRAVIADHFRSPIEFQRIDGDDAVVEDPRERLFNRETITYNRHWAVFVAKAWAPLLALFALIVGGGFFLLTFPFVMIYLIVGAVLLAIIFGFLFYYYDDWKNDLFQLTPTQVIDIDRKPFRLDEDRKIADITNIQNVQVLRPTLIAALLQYGDVIIETAGATADIVFESVSNPNKIQADIFERREWIERQQRSAVRKEGHTDFLMMLEEFQRLKEQDKIPRRTPPLEYDLGADEDDAASDLDW